MVREKPPSTQIRVKAAVSLVNIGVAYTFGRPIVETRAIVVGNGSLTQPINEPQRNFAISEFLALVNYPAVVDGM